MFLFVLFFLIPDAHLTEDCPHPTKTDRQITFWLIQWVILLSVWVSKCCLLYWAPVSPCSSMSFGCQIYDLIACLLNSSSFQYFSSSHVWLIKVDCLYPSWLDFSTSFFWCWVYLIFIVVPYVPTKLKKKFCHLFGANGKFVEFHWQHSCVLWLSFNQNHSIILWRGFLCPFSKRLVLHSRNWTGI